jgi:hypothetical protein
MLLQFVSKSILQDDLNVEEFYTGKVVGGEGLTG